MFTCRICGNNRNNKSYKGEETRMGLGHEFVYVKCSNCGCLQIEEYPLNIAEYYDGYGSLEQQNAKEALYNIFLRKQLIKYRITTHNFLGKLIAQLIPGSFRWILPNMFDFNSSIIDIGCGAGRLALKMANTGFNNISGIDPFLDNDIIYRLKNREVVIKKQDIYKLQGYYDFIMLHHVLEHMPNQYMVFEKLASLMHKNSKLLINIPIIDSYAWDNYKMKAFQLADIPRHYYLHSVDSIKFLAEKYKFEVEQVQYYVDKNVMTGIDNKTAAKLLKSQQTGLCCFYLSLK